MLPSTCPAKQISGGQQEEGHREVHHVQGEYHQTFFLHHYQNASIQGIKIQCRMDQLYVSHVDKDTVEQSHTTPKSICKEYLIHPLVTRTF